MSLPAVDAVSSIAENIIMVKSFREDFGKKLKQLRQEKKITQEELSFRANVSRSHIGMIEKGLRDISLSFIFKLSRALDTPIYKLFDFDDIEKYSDDYKYTA